MPKKKLASILKDANLEAENIKKDKILQAKEKFLELEIGTRKGNFIER